MSIFKNLSMATAGAAFIALGTVDVVQAVTLVDTTLGKADDSFKWNGSFNMGESNFGVSNIGQTFVTPNSDNVLSNFTFFLRQQFNPDVTDFRAYVAPFDSNTNTITGAILYESSSTSTAPFSSNLPTQTFTFSPPGGLTLIPGQEYVALLSPVKDLDGIYGESASLIVGANFTPPYSDAGGKAVTNKATTFSALATTPFSNIGTPPNFTDFGFKATLTSDAPPPPNPTPIPFEFSPSLGILLLGAWGFGARLKSIAQKRKFSRSAFSKN